METLSDRFSSTPSVESSVNRDSRPRPDRVRRTPTLSEEGRGKKDPKTLPHTFWRVPVPSWSMSFFLVRGLSTVFSQENRLLARFTHRPRSVI